MLVNCTFLEYRYTFCEIASCFLAEYLNIKNVLWYLIQHQNFELIRDRFATSFLLTKYEVSYKEFLNCS